MFNVWIIQFFNQAVFFVVVVFFLCVCVFFLNISCKAGNIVIVTRYIVNDILSFYVQWQA